MKYSPLSEPIRSGRLKGAIAVRAVIEFVGKPIVFVSKEWLTKLVSRTTYPKRCRHGCGDSVICDACRFVWEKRVRRAREGILAKLKRPEALEAEVRECAEEQARTDAGRIRAWADGAGPSAQAVLDNPNLDASAKLLAEVFLHAVRERERLARLAEAKWWEHLAPSECEPDCMYCARLDALGDKWTEEQEPGRRHDPGPLEAQGEKEAG